MVIGRVFDEHAGSPGLHPQYCIKACNPAPRRWRQEDQELTVTLKHGVSLGSALGYMKQYFKIL